MISKQLVTLKNDIYEVENFENFINFDYFPILKIKDTLVKYDYKSHFP